MLLLTTFYWNRNFWGHNLAIQSLQFYNRKRGRLEQDFQMLTSMWLRRFQKSFKTS